MLLRIEKFYILPIFAALNVLANFAILGTDKARYSLLILAITSVMALVAFYIVTPRKGMTVKISNFRNLLIVFAIFIIAISILPISHFVKEYFGLKGYLIGKGLYDPSMTMLESIKLLGVFSAFILGVSLAQNNELGRQAFENILFACVVWGVASIILNSLDEFGTYGIANGFNGRLGGAFSSPNSAGTLFAATAVMYAVLLMSRMMKQTFFDIKSTNSYWAIAGIFVCITALFLTASRSAITITFLCLMFFGYMIFRGRIKGYYFLIALPLIPLVFFLAFFDASKAFFARFGTFGVDAVTRANIFQAHYDFYKDNMIWGYGLGSFSPINAAITNEGNYNTLALLNTMHNVYLQWLEETGIIGLVALIILNIAILKPIYDNAISLNRGASICLAVLAGYLVFLLHGMSDFAFQEPALAIFTAILLGIGFGLASIENSQKVKKNRRKVRSI